MNESNPEYYETIFTPAHIVQLRRLMSLRKTGVFSWKDMIIGLSMPYSDAKYVADAANEFPAALNSIEASHARIRVMQEAIRSALIFFSHLVFEEQIEKDTVMEITLKLSSAMKGETK